MIEDTARQALAATRCNETILLVDDEEVARQMLVEVLTHQGYAVLDAGRGAAALALAEKAPIDLLVTDLSMPGMSGWDLAKCRRARHPGLPVLFISGYNEHETACWGRMDPPVKRLFKPFSLGTFLHEARQMLDYEKKTPAPGLEEKSGAAGPCGPS